MGSFRFLHAADLHLDSPLIGLSNKSPEFAQRVETASREAFDNLIALAIEEECRFVVLAGDVFDGDVRNFQIALYFMDGMWRLGEAGIEVFVIRGNHNSANRFAGNVHVFGKTRAETKRLEEISVAVHGRSFPRADFSENMGGSIPSRSRVGSTLASCTRPAREARESMRATRPARSSNSPITAMSIGRSATCMVTRS